MYIKEKQAPKNYLTKLSINSIKNFPRILYLYFIITFQFYLFVCF